MRVLCFFLRSQRIINNHFNFMNIYISLSQIIILVYKIENLKYIIDVLYTFNSTIIKQIIRFKYRLRIRTLKFMHSH